MIRKVGMPKDTYRVHWLLVCVSKYVSSNYQCSYDYFGNSYMFFRRSACVTSRDFRYMDFFTVVRTSKKCMRVVFHNNETAESEYKSFKKWQQVADYIDFKSRQIHDNRFWWQDRDYLKRKYNLK